MTRLHRADRSGPGLTRVRRGRGFSYLDAHGERIDDARHLERIRALAIPPAWTDVWICPDPWGHLQAVGCDGDGRRQYLYHQAWRTRRDVEKFTRLEAFAEALPDVRRTVDRSLTRRGMPKERALAVAIRLLDQAFFRIGSEHYTTRNGSFGLATIRKSQIEIHGGMAIFDYTAKGGIHRVQTIQDEALMKPLRIMKERDGGGRDLLAYRDEHRWHDLRSGEINDYLKLLAGEQHSSKDFRTWHATVLAAVEFAGARANGSAASIRQTTTNTVKLVAEHLGNTPAVARSSYIDPRVIDRFREGQTIDPALADVRWDQPRRRRRAEGEVLDLVRHGR